MTLKKGLKNGTIDCINSNHTPWHLEGKELEFLYAEFGAIGLESTFGLANLALNKTISIEALIEKMTLRNREIFSLPIPEIEEGAIANLTIFQPGVKWEFSKSSIYSKSKNSPLIGKQLNGKVIAVINNKKVSLA